MGYYKAEKHKYDRVSFEKALNDVSTLVGEKIKRLEPMI
jgi:hypothetical protein